MADDELRLHTRQEETIQKAGYGEKANGLIKITNIGWPSHATALVNFYTNREDDGSPNAVAAAGLTTKTDRSVRSELSEYI